MTRIQRLKMKKQVRFVFALMLLCVIMLGIIIGNIIHIVKLNNKEPIIITDTQVQTQIITKEIPVEIIPETIYYKVSLSTEVQDVIFEECNKYNIPSSLIIAMIEKESDYRENLMGDSGNSYGLMQIQKKYHQETMLSLGGTDLINPIDNVRTGIYIINNLIQKGKGVRWALMAYNGGESYANRKINNGEVSNYVITILARSVELELERINNK